MDTLPAMHSGAASGRSDAAGAGLHSGENPGVLQGAQQTPGAQDMQGAQGVQQTPGAQDMQGAQHAVVFAANRAIVRREQKRLAAECAGGVFGTTVATVPDWLADRWGLFGTGEQPVGRDRRMLLVRKALAGCDLLEATPGTIELAAGLARDALPLFELPECDEALLNEAAPTSAETSAAELNAAESIAAELNAAERELVAVLRRYAQLLAACDLIEPSQIAVRVPIPENTACSFIGFDELPPAYRLLRQRWCGHAEGCAQGEGAGRELLQGDVLLPGQPPEQAAGQPPEQLPGQPSEQAPSRELPLPAPEKLRALLPEGDTATDRLLLQTLKEAPLPAVVAMCDPLSHFEHLQPELLRAGLSVAVRASIPFAGTPFGRGYCALLRLRTDDAATASCAADFALSPVSGIPFSAAQEMVAAWRKDRALASADYLAAVREASPFFAGYEFGAVPPCGAQHAAEAAAIAHAADAVRSVEAVAGAAAAGGREHEDGQAGACESGQVDVRESERAGACESEEQLLFLLESASVPVSRLVAPVRDAQNAALCAEPVATSEAAGFSSEVADFSSEAAPDVRFMTLQDAADLAPGSAATVVLGDLTAAAYPVRQPETAATMLLQKLGIASSGDALAEARRMFARACAVAREAVYLERPLHDENADEAYAAAMLEDFIDDMRAVEADAPGGDASLDAPAGSTSESPAAPAAPAGAGNASASPEGAACISDSVVRLGKRSGLPVWLAERAVCAGEGDLQLNACLQGPGETAVQKPLAPMDRVCDARRPFVLLQPALLSASAIETYLECPCKWFATRRLKLDEAVAGFGPLQKGSFAHSVLRRFHEQMYDINERRVTEQNLSRAQALLDGVFDSELARQRTLPYEDNPLIATSALEEAELGALRVQLHALVAREAGLLPGFEPAHFELAFGPDDAVEYAGVRIVGSIDRIDVDAQGRAVVIDYKGSVGKDYAAAAFSPVLLPAGAAGADAAGAAGAGAAAAEASIVLPHKVQALVYAQVARRLLGVQPVAALYLGYGRAGGTAGAYDRTVLSPRDIPEAKAADCGIPLSAAQNTTQDAKGSATGSSSASTAQPPAASASASTAQPPVGEPLFPDGFCDYLDAVEQRIATALGSLERGRIAAVPRGRSACDYCPVRPCEQRKGA